jgi:hypothetical protein
MRLDQSERQISLRRKLREHPPDTFGDAVELCRRCYPELDEPQVTEIAATEQPHLWRASQQRETYLTRGGKRGEKGAGLSTAPPSDRYGNVALRDFDAAERLDLAGDDRRKNNGQIEGRGKSRGRESILDEIDPRRTASAGADLENDQPDEDDVDPYADPDEEVTRLAAKEVEKSGASVRDFKAFNAALKTVAIRNPRLMKRWGAGNKSTAAGRATTDRFRDV